MRTLYEIDQDILSCIDAETGELLDLDRLTELQMEKDKKIENVVLYIKDLFAESSAINEEIATLKKRKEAADAKADKLKSWISEILSGQKFKTAKCEVRFRRSVSVDVLSTDSLPAQFTRETVTVSPDKVKIKEFLKNGGTLDGCKLIENLNAQIM